nr:MAG TPA: hypothetical protein [Caudoviricetes sp.]DAY00829.1 MAG TPA: hypothetical protein [Caudoviricetes sp.]
MNYVLVLTYYIVFSGLIQVAFSKQDLYLEN